MSCAGSGGRPSSAVFRLGCSAPVPGRRRRLWQQPGSVTGSVPVVSRGGRPDLAGEALDQVRAPTLLIVGGVDFEVIELNEQAFARLKGLKALEIVPGASHLFPEPGALEAAIGHAARWFERHLRFKSPGLDRTARLQT